MNIPQSKIQEAARLHAQSMLGKQQYESNSDARKAIEHDFKAGVKWAIKEDFDSKR